MDLNAALIDRKLLAVFPPQAVEGVVVPHDCEECNEMRRRLTKVTWHDLSVEFVRSHDGSLPLLSHAAYLAFLPAWLRNTLADPDGPVAQMVMVNLQHEPDTSGFTAEQAAVIVEVARYVAQHSVFGAEDPVNVESVQEIERIWGPLAA
jgi:hypothetical protein